MGFLKNIFNKSPEVYEQNGDACIRNGLPGPAKIEYEKAIEKLIKETPNDAKMQQRLEQKIRDAKEALAREHLETADNLIETGYLDDARVYLELALELTEDSEFASVVEEKIGQTHRSGAAIPGAAVDSDAEYFEDDGPEDFQDENEYVAALWGTLPEDIQEAYFSYGDDFKSGYVALNQGEFELAAGYLFRAMQANPSPESYIPLELATAYLNLENYDKARQLLEEFLTYHSDTLPAYEILCEVLWETGAFEDAQLLLASCSSEIKESLAYYLLNGETLTRAGKYDQAKSYYLNFFDSYGWNEQIGMAFARTYEAMGDAEAARDMYGRIMNECRSCHSRVSPIVKRKFADLSFSTGNQSDGILELYLSLVQEDPKNAGFYYDRVSQMYADKGNEAEARRFRGFAEEVHAREVD